MSKRSSGLLKWDSTGTIKMGLNYPCNVIECFPGDSFRLEMKSLMRFLPQVAPTMSNVIATVDTYTVPLRQLCDKLGISWDDLLTGGEDGDANIDIPQITIPQTGYEAGSLADWLGYPTNYIDMDTGEKVINGAGLTLTAWPVLAYMHIINENYRDQNFIKKLDLKKYQDFLDGTYKFETPSGDPIDYAIQRNGLFPKAWTRDYFGRALPNTQRGPQAQLPIGDTALLSPSKAPVFLSNTYFANFTGNYSTPVITASLPSGGNTTLDFKTPVVTISSGRVVSNGEILYKGKVYTVDGSRYTNGTLTATVSSGSCSLQWTYAGGAASGLGNIGNSFNAENYNVTSSGSYADLSDVNADLASATAASIIAFRMAARMQRFGEILQYAGARAVEYTLAMFGVRIPDGRVQRPIFHGSYRMPVIFSEVLQTSSTDTTSPQGNMAGHGITGGVNSPIHIKVIEHSFVISILNVMPRSQYRDFIPAHLLRRTRMDIPVPMMQGIGDQPIKRVQIFPNSKNPDDAFGFAPQYQDLWFIPSGLHGHMKDTYLHWNMARVYKDEPVLSAAWRYEPPTDRSFAVKDEDHIQVQIGFEMRARRPFAKNKVPGIHIV